MTPFQWLFHYLEIMKHKKDNIKNILEPTVEEIRQLLIFVGSCSDEERARALVEELYKKKENKLSETDEEQITELKKAPRELEVKISEGIETIRKEDSDKILKKFIPKLEYYEKK